MTFMLIARLARFVMNVRLPLWLVASASPASANVLHNSCVIVLADNLPALRWLGKSG